MRRGLYTIEFEPVVQIGDYVELLPKQVFGGTIYKVSKLVPIPVAAVIDLGSIPANSSMSGYKEITELKLPPNWFGQWRIYVKDDIIIDDMRYKGRAGTMFWSLAEHTGFLDKTAPGSHLAEIYTWQDDKLYIKARNIHDFDLPKARIKISGYVFKVEIATETPKAYTRIPIGALRVVE